MAAPAPVRPVPAGPTEPAQTGRAQHRRRRPLRDGRALAIADNPIFKLSRLDIDRPPPSYTVDLLQNLQSPDKDLFFIAGADILPELPRWRAPDEILRLARLIVVNRPGWPDPNLAELEIALPGSRHRTELVHIPGVDIAAAELRARVRANQSIRYLTPPAVEAFIHAKGLYHRSKASPLGGIRPRAARVRELSVLARPGRLGGEFYAEAGAWGSRYGWRPRRGRRVPRRRGGRWPGPGPNRRALGCGRGRRGRSGRTPAAGRRAECPAPSSSTSRSANGGPPPHGNLDRAGAVAGVTQRVLHQVPDDLSKPLVVAVHHDRFSLDRDPPLLVSSHAPDDLAGEQVKSQRHALGYNRRGPILPAVVGRAPISEPCGPPLVSADLNARQAAGLSFKKIEIPRTVVRAASVTRATYLPTLSRDTTSTRATRSLNECVSGWMTRAPPSHAARAAAAAAASAPSAATRSAWRTSMSSTAGSSSEPSNSV